MNLRQPALRKHSTGIYTARWGGRDHYFTRDQQESERLFSDPASTHPGSLARWHEWAESRRSGHARPARPTVLQVVDVHKLMLESYLDADRTHASGYFRKSLRLFVQIHGEAPILDLASPNPSRGRYAAPVVALVNALASDMARRKDPPAPKTILHMIVSVQRLFNFAAEQGLSPAVSWQGLKKPRVRPGDPEVWTVERIAQAIAATAEPDDSRASAVARRGRPELVPWLALCYLTVGRVSELPRLVSGEGRFLPVVDERGRQMHARGLFAPDEYKSAWRGDAALQRYLVLTDEALEWLALARPVWTRLDSFSSAARSAGFAGGPHVLRDSAASHLRSRGVALADVQQLLGHSKPGAWRSYARVPFDDLRRKAARITLRPFLDPRVFATPSRTRSGHGER